MSKDDTKVMWRFSGKRTRDGIKVYGEFPFVYEEGRECYNLAAFWRYVQQGYIDPNTVGIIKEVIWKYWKFGRLTIRTNNLGFWFGFEWKLKHNKGLYDLKITPKSFKCQWLPF